MSIVVMSVVFIGSAIGLGLVRQLRNIGVL